MRKISVLVKYGTYSQDAESMSMNGTKLSASDRFLVNSRRLFAAKSILASAMAAFHGLHFMLF
jgi:hypothetical protein